MSTTYFILPYIVCAQQLTIFVSMSNTLSSLFARATGARPSRKEKPYYAFPWQRPDLIDPPLRPLPRSRPRRLSNVDGTHAQSQSALIARIPVEVRMLIWEHVVGRSHDGDVLHIELADGILRHYRCYEPDSELPVFQHNCWRAPWRKSFRQGPLRGVKEPPNHRYAFLPLLFTCKLMYVLARSISHRRLHCVDTMKVWTCSTQPTHSIFGEPTASSDYQASCFPIACNN